jgi:hypothetical protein
MKNDIEVSILLKIGDATPVQSMTVCLPPDAPVSRLYGMLPALVDEFATAMRHSAAQKAILAAVKQERLLKAHQDEGA